ncbi:MAG: glycosyltransferase family 2 protein [Hyphomonadaceae bacterium]|nr:glycosyltransferase family 2 protein [Hyphomonadaceae bacterium]
MNLTGHPLTAVVTPVYNGAKFLNAAIEAVQAQTYRPLVHCILDNASTDATAEIIAQAQAAGGPVPIITARNPELLAQVANFNAVLKLIPPEARYFKLLCADDSMTPNAVEAMVKAALSAPGVTVVGAVERVNGAARPHRFPAETSIFEGPNAVARVFADDARIPGPHVLFRTDCIRPHEDFFDASFIGFDTEAYLRILSRGGKFAFVHEEVLDSLHHDEALTATDRKFQTMLYEKLVLVERYGPYVFSNSEYAHMRQYRLRVLYRRLLFWRLTGHWELFRRDMGRLRERGLAPSFWDYADSVLSWPEHLYEKRVSGMREPRPWPADAVRAAY